MDKEQLPKLNTEGFTTVAAPRRTPSNRPTSITQRIVGPAGRAHKRESDNDEVDVGFKRLMIKTGVCAAIAVVILALSSIDTPVTNSITDTIGETVNHEFDIEEDIGRLKFVQNLSDDVQGVFSTSEVTSAVYPAEGEVVTAFGESGSQGVRFAPVGTEIVSIAKGTVTEVGEIDGMGYVKVALDSGETAVYHNVSPQVQQNDIVMPGQPVGHTQDDYLYLELTSDGEYIDPMAFIKQRAAIVVQ
jgi:murein DD-endopeptidase MepM/ murein hydrolase activator NlpD